MKKTATRPRIAKAETLRVAYHQGPPEIGFNGAEWRRGVWLTVTPAEWAAMRARADFNNFDFRIAPATPAEEE